MNGGWFFFRWFMTTAAATPPTMATAITPTTTHTQTGVEPLSSSSVEACLLLAAAFLGALSFPLTSCESRSSKVTLLPSTLPPSASVTLPGKVTLWEYFTPSDGGELDVSDELPVLTMYSSPLCLIWPSLLSMLSLPSMVQVRVSPFSLNVAFALPSLNKSPLQSLSVRAPKPVWSVMTAFNV